MNTDSNFECETTDVKKVDAAMDALVEGAFDVAESLLLSVIANTPEEYFNTREDDGEIAIKFWDQTSFLHYVMWTDAQTDDTKRVIWIGNAYPRAHYYMGFLCVKRKEFDLAIEYLDKGQSLEPTNPGFHLEKAQALIHAGRKQEALPLYDHVTEMNAYISSRDLALAQRGRGFLLIELGDLDEAEMAFRFSLEIEPDSEVAINELQYIEDLRQGGSATSHGMVQTNYKNYSHCADCGKPFEKGMLVSRNAAPTAICNRCHDKQTKKWWEFWK